MKTLSRRGMLKLIGLTATGSVLAACTPTAQPTTVNEPAAAEPTKVAANATEATKVPDPTKAPPPAKTVKITLIESWFGVPQFNESIDPINAVISDKMKSEGLNIEIQSMILDDHAGKYATLYASGADFTMAFDAPWYQMNTLRTQGALLPLGDLIAKFGSNLKAEITDKIYDFNLINGECYGIPAAYYYSGTTGVILRYDLLKKYGAPEPTSEGGYPSLEPFLQAVKDNDPSLLPFANDPTYFMDAANVWNRLAWAPGGVGGGFGIGNVMESNEFVDNETIGSQLEAWKLTRSWWEKGLINKEDLTTQNVLADFILPGKAAAKQENEPDFKWVDYDKQMKSSDAEAELRGYDLTGMRAGKVKSLGNLKQWNFIVFNSNAPTEQHEAGIQFYDWLSSSQDNMDLWLMGVDGENYKKEANMRFTEIEGVDQSRNYRRQWYISGLSGRFQRMPLDLPKEAEEAVAFFTTESNFVFNPYEKFEPDLKPIELDIAQLTAVSQEAAHGLSTGQMPTEEALVKYAQTLDGAGRQALKEKVQKQLDDWIAANK
jgi:putative aldouronate transport system substrate-binding protein